jgi:hypothetical protein
MSENRSNVIYALAALLGAVGVDARAAVVGILGAVAGYLFGKDTRD